MQKKTLIKINKKVLCILILFVLIYTMFGFSPRTILKSYGATYTFTVNSNNLPSDFDAKYPGYRSLLQNLVNAHPNWKFKLVETNLNWETVINNEYQGHGGSPKNLVPKSYSDGWICEICGRRAYDNGSWCCASRQAIEYTMDPRNTLNELNVFQYLELTNDTNITKDQVAQMASKISYLNKQNIIDGIYEVANDPNYNVNPFYIIGKILQEQGSNAGVMCSGNGYQGQYVGYYNLFNVGASGNTNYDVIMNGLRRAYDKGWDTPQKSIMGGINLIVKNYIKYGQDTLYFQKFNVIDTPYYSNQYAQNVLDSKSIGTTLRGYYKDAGLLESSFTFRVPLFLNMPSQACPTPTVQPGQTGERAYINANGGLSLRDAPNGTTITYVMQGTEVLILERAQSKLGGYYWDKVSTPNGTGYMAREAQDGSKTYLMPLDGNNNTNTNTNTDNNTSDPIDDIVKVEPNATVNDIKEKYSNAIVLDKDDKEVTGDTLVGTGAKIKIDGVIKYTIIKLGDASGDGKITASDYVQIKNHIMNVTLLGNIFKKGADVNKDGSITPADYVQIKNHIMKVSSITL